MTKKERFISALLGPINPAAVVLLGVYTVVWGLWVAAPFWPAFQQASMYSVLISALPSFIPPELFWGAVAVVCGIITIYGAYTRSYKSLVRGSSIAFWHWLMITIFFFWGNWMDPGVVQTLIFAIYAAYVYLNIRVNFKDRPESNEILH